MSIRNKICRWRNHPTNREIIEEFSRKESVRFYIEAGGKMYFMPHVHSAIEARSRCKRCGAICNDTVTQRRWLTPEELRTSR